MIPARFHPLLGCCALVMSLSVAGQSPEQLKSVLAGRELSAADADAREERLRRDPHDRTARLELVGYHWGRQYADSESAQRRGELLFWMIDNDPRNALLAMPFGLVQPHLTPRIFLRAKERWVEHLEEEPDDATLLGNMAAMLADPSTIAHDRANRDLAVSLLERAQVVDPRNAEWPFRLGFVIWLEAVGTSDPSREIATRALRHFQRAHRLGGIYGPAALQFAMDAAIATGDVGDARGYALEVLESDTGDLRDLEHRAHVVLGRIALIDGDTERAGESLLAAGSALATSSSWSPNMRLARELLGRGEREVVLEFFELCARFWERDRPEEWAAVVRQGRIPDFDAEFLY